MKSAASLAIASAGSVAAQDARVTIQETTEAGRYVVIAEFLGQLPPSANSFDVVWSDASFRLTGDADITFDAWNPRYRSDSFGDPFLVQNGRPEATFTGFMASTFVAGVFGELPPDSSNPLLVASFLFDGAIASLGFELVSQNSVIFETGAADGLPMVELYQDAQGVAGTRTLEATIGFGQFPADELSFFVPGPGTLTITSMTLFAARRCRK
ncbi:MAG: hypothetical protein AAF937_05915 [Planctomycetota bacterium]